MARKRTVKKTPEASSRFTDSYDALKLRMHDQSEKIKELQTKATTKMSENPIQTAAIAFGIGVVAGIGLKVLIDSKRD